MQILAATCKIDTLHDSLLHDHIICGILDSHLREELLKEQNLDLAKRIQICLAAELSKERKKAIETNESIHRLKNKRSSRYSNRKSASNVTGRQRQNKQPQTFKRNACKYRRDCHETFRRMAKCIPKATKYITSQLSVSQGPRRRVFVNFKQDMQSKATLKAIMMT